MARLQPNRHHQQEIHCTICNDLPEDIFAILRIQYYDDGWPAEAEEIRVSEKDGYEAFAHLVRTSAMLGADILIQTAYDPKDLGLVP